MKKLLIALMVCLAVSGFAKGKKVLTKEGFTTEKQRSEAAASKSEDADQEEKASTAKEDDQKSSSGKKSGKGKKSSAKGDAAVSGWSEDYARCQELAKSTNRPIFALFTGSDWCGWCVRLNNEVLSQKAFQDYADKSLILFKADFPKSIHQSNELKSQNRSLQQKYGIRGYPTVLLLDASGNVLGKTGYKQGGPEAYVANLQSMLGK